MDWVTLVSTGVGALIALSGALLASMRTGHDDLARERETHHRRVYVDFATALDSAHASLRAVLRAPVTPDRAALARSAVDESGLFRSREQLLMFGSETVAIAGESAFLALRAVEAVAATDVELASQAYHDVYHDLADRLWSLRMVVRADMGEPTFQPAEFGHADWSERHECARCASVT